MGIIQNILMAFRDNMTPSPKKSSKGSEDRSDKRSPKKSRLSKMHDGHSIKNEDFGDHKLSRRNRDGSNDVNSKGGTDGKRKRSVSPKHEPSSSKYFDQSKTSYHEVNDEKRRRHQSSSEHRYTEEEGHRNRVSDQDYPESRYHGGSPSRSDYSLSRSSSRDYRERHVQRQEKEQHRSKSPTGPKRYNDGYGKPLPPGAKGNISGTIPIVESTVL